LEILALGVLLSAFLLGLVLGAPYIRALRRFRIGQNIRPEGPQSHYVKQGIPTMGGALFIGVTSVLWLFVLLLLPQVQRDVFIPQTIVPIGTLIAVGLLGAIDDLVNVRYGFGIRGRHKLVWQLIVGLVAAIYIQRHFGITGVYVPLVGEWEIGGGLFVALRALHRSSRCRTA
jgi:phospho-N-acetylmuramoyl-pentapeptide-transferase